MNDIEEQKAQAVQRELLGLPVRYARHNISGEGLTPNMAKVNGYSIIWHKYAYSAEEPDNVEVMLPGGEIEEHVPIKKLRKLVS